MKRPIQNYELYQQKVNEINNIIQSGFRFDGGTISQTKTIKAISEEIYDYIYGEGI